MAIDLGDIPSGTEPTTAEKLQIRSAIGVGTTDAPTFLGVNINAPGAVPESGMAWSGSNHLAFFHNSAIRMVVISTGTTIGSDMAYSWGAAGIPTSASRDLILARDAAGILAQRNGVNAQAFRVYNSTDATPATNYDRGVFDFKTTTNTLRIGTENGGTYTLARPIDFVTGGVARWQISAAGNFIASTDGLYDIGASGANRPRSLYLGSSLLIGGAAVYVAGGAVVVRGSSGAGGLEIQGVWATQGGRLDFYQRVKITPQEDGVLSLQNNASSGFNRIQLGGTTSAFPAIKRNGTGIDIVLADDSAFAPVKGKLTTDTAYTATVVTPTGFLTLYDSTGTAYRVPCVV